jgi:hypothetical protein
MAIIGGSGNYNYNTLTRTNDGTAFEFNTNASVLFVDELPSGVTLTATFDSPANPAITLREKVQLRFKQTNRIIFTPSAGTVGTIRIFLFLDESNVDEFDMSFYSTQVVGTTDVDLIQITGNADYATSFGERNYVLNPKDYTFGTDYFSAVSLSNSASTTTLIADTGSTNDYYILGYNIKKELASGNFTVDVQDVATSSSTQVLTGSTAVSANFNSDFTVPIKLPQNHKVVTITNNSTAVLTVLKYLVRS